MLHCQARGRIAAAQLRIPAGALGLTGSDRRARHSSIYAASHYPRARPAPGPLYRLASTSLGHPLLSPPGAASSSGAAWVMKRVTR
jgi:hypothetical protein